MHVLPNTYIVKIHSLKRLSGMCGIIQIQRICREGELGRGQYKALMPQSTLPGEHGYLLPSKLRGPSESITLLLTRAEK